jgi:acyl-CoA synthetase (AMP-forming)/AMP-acid ligase II
MVLPIERPIDEAMAPLLARGSGEAELPAVAPEDDATILFTSGSTGAAKGAVSTHRAVTTGVYAYTLGLATLLGIKESKAAAGQPAAHPDQRSALSTCTGDGAGASEQLRRSARGMC